MAQILERLFQSQGTTEFLLRALTALILGSLIGFERQWTRHPAGLTNILVCLGSFFFTSFSFIFTSDPLLHDIRDITRVAAQVVTGIGFLGAGVIMRQGLNIKGLNTAATIWCSGFHRRAVRLRQPLVADYCNGCGARGQCVPAPHSGKNSQPQEQ